MNSKFYKSDRIFPVFDVEAFDCCTHQSVPDIKTIIAHLLRSGSTPPGVEMNLPEPHNVSDTFDTDISYRNPALKDLNKQYYAMKKASTGFNEALKEAAEVAAAHKSTVDSNITK